MTVGAGKVRWFDSQRGYGFLLDDDGGKDVFVHWTGISPTESDDNGRRNLREGQRVEFDIEQGRKGPQATNVRVVEEV